MVGLTLVALFMGSPYGIGFGVFAYLFILGQHDQHDEVKYYAEKFYETIE